MGVPTFGPGRDRKWALSWLRDVTEHACASSALAEREVTRTSEDLDGAMLG